MLFGIQLPKVNVKINADADVLSVMRHLILWHNVRRVYGTGDNMHDCQNDAKLTAPQQCEQLLRTVWAGRD